MVKPRGAGVGREADRERRGEEVISSALARAASGAMLSQPPAGCHGAASLSR